mgnify:CR=1 FL=1
MYLYSRTLYTSLQVGDLVYATNTTTQIGAEDLEASPSVTGGVGNTHIVGILRRITMQLGGIVELDVDETAVSNPLIPVPPAFIMFSKYTQTDGDIAGYYAEAKFKNNSIEKAEIYSVGSEVIINSK